MRNFVLRTKWIEGKTKNVNKYTWPSQVKARDIFETPNTCHKCDSSELGHHVQTQCHVWGRIIVWQWERKVEEIRMHIILYKMTYSELSTILSLNTKNQIKSSVGHLSWPSVRSACVEDGRHDCPMEDSDHLALEGQWSRFELKTLANRVNTSRSAHAVEGRKILNCFGAFYKYKSGQKIVGCVVTTRRILATLQLQGNENGRVVTIAPFYRYQINTWRFAIFSRLLLILLKLHQY
jgi:hypothetical protein